MPDEQPPKKDVVRFDFPRGASAEKIAQALNEARERLMAEWKVKKANQSPNEDSPEEPK